MARTAEVRGCGPQRGSHQHWKSVTKHAVSNIVTKKCRASVPHFRGLGQVAKSGRADNCDGFRNDLPNTSAGKTWESYLDTWLQSVTDGGQGDDHLTGEPITQAGGPINYVVNVAGFCRAETRKRCQPKKRHTQTRLHTWTCGARASAKPRS